MLLVAGSYVTFAQTGNSKKSNNTTAQTSTASYTCPMHPDVKADKPGKCPKCGMDLVQSKTEASPGKTYTCSMHPDVISDKPGNCPECGMNLSAKKSGKKMKMKGMMGCM